MAFARLAVNDTSSEVIDEIKYAVNTLYFMLETAGTSITAGATAADVLSAWSAGIAAGRDNNPAATANITSTNRECVLILSTPLIPRKPHMGLKAVTTASSGL